MKRSSFKKKPYSDIISKKQAKYTERAKKRATRQIGGKKRKKKTDRKKLEKDVWELCRQITFKRYGNTCYTTGATGLSGMNLQCGHGKAKGALPLLYKYDLRNLRPQSFRANINLGGMSDIFIARLEREKEGLEFLQEACVKENGEWKIKHISPMGSLQAEEFLRGLKERYTEILNELNK